MNNENEISGVQQWSMVVIAIAAFAVGVGIAVIISNCHFDNGVKRRAGTREPQRESSS